jgi:hypothetical protein
MMRLALTPNSRQQASVHPSDYLWAVVNSDSMLILKLFCSSAEANAYLRGLGRNHRVFRGRVNSEGNEFSPQ